MNRHTGYAPLRPASQQRMYPRIPPMATQPLVLHDEQRQALLPPGYAPPAGRCAQPSCACVLCLCAMLGVAATIAVPLVVMANSHRAVVTHSLLAGMSRSGRLAPPPSAATSTPTLAPSPYPPPAAARPGTATAHEAARVATATGLGGVRTDRTPSTSPDAKSVQKRPANRTAERSGGATR